MLEPARSVFYNSRMDILPSPAKRNKLLRGSTAVAGVLGIALLGACTDQAPTTGTSTSAEAPPPLAPRGRLSCSLSVLVRGSVASFTTTISGASAEAGVFDVGDINYTYGDGQSNDHGQEQGEVHRYNNSGTYPALSALVVSVAPNVDGAPYKDGAVIPCGGTPVIIR